MCIYNVIKVLFNSNAWVGNSSVMVGISSEREREREREREGERERERETDI